MFYRLYCYSTCPCSVFLPASEHCQYLFECTTRPSTRPICWCEAISWFSATYQPNQVTESCRSCGIEVRFSYFLEVLVACTSIAGVVNRVCVHGISPINSYPFMDVSLSPSCRDNLSAMIHNAHRRYRI